MERMRAVSRVAILTIATFLVALSAAPAFAQFAGALTVTSIRVTAADTDGSGLWDTILVNTTVQVATEGLFEIRAQVNIPVNGSYGSYEYESNGTDVNWAAGTHAVTVGLSAAWIAVEGTAGPYPLGVDILAPVPGNFGTREVAYNTTTTPAWASSQFDGVPVSIRGPLSDTGVDVHGDGHYDALVVSVPLHVTRATMVDVDATLLLPTTTLLPDPQPWRNLMPGDHVWNLTFDGNPFYFDQASGPYRVGVQLRFARTPDGAGHTANATFYSTAGYIWTDFARPPADFSGTPTLTPVDTDGNGKANFLDIRIPLRVRIAGNYSLGLFGCALCSMANVTFPARNLHLEPGSLTVDYNLSGIALNRLPAMPSFPLSLYVQSLDSPAWTWNLTTATYNAFDPTAFDSRTTAYLDVNVAGAGHVPPCANVYAMDPTTKAVFTPGLGAPAQPFASLGLYNGTFEILVKACSPWASAVVDRVSVSGLTYLNVTLPTSSAYGLGFDVAMQGWDRGTADLSVNWSEDSPEVRWWADAGGNMDGYADNSEMALAATGLGLYLSPPPRFPPAGPVAVTVDGMPFYWTDTVPHSATGAGSDASSAPLTTTFRRILSAAGPVSSGSQHTLAVDVPFSGPNLAVHLSVTLPPGAAGTANLSSHILTPYQGFDLPANATMTAAGTGSWSEDVGWQPANLTPNTFARMTVNGVQATPPSLSSVLIIGLLVGVPIIAIVAVLLLLRRRRKQAQPAAVPTPPPPPP